MLRKRCRGHDSRRKHDQYEQRTPQTHSSSRGKESDNRRYCVRVQLRSYCDTFFREMGVASPSDWESASTGHSCRSPDADFTADESLDGLPCDKFTLTSNFGPPRRTTRGKTGIWTVTHAPSRLYRRIPR